MENKSKLCVFFPDLLLIVRNEYQNRGVISSLWGSLYRIF